MWNRPLTAEEMIKIAKDCVYPDDRPQIIDWATAEWKLVGDVTAVSELCNFQFSIQCLVIFKQIF